MARRVACNTTAYVRRSVRVILYGGWPASVTEADVWVEPVGGGKVTALYLDGERSALAVDEARGGKVLLPGLDLAPWGGRVPAVEAEVE